MKNQEKLPTGSSKLKVHRANSQTISSYPVRFSTDIFFISFFCFFCLVGGGVFFLLFFFVFFFKLKIYNPIHIGLCGRVSDKNLFTRPFSGNKTTFFFGLMPANIYQSNLFVQSHFLNIC